MISRRTFLSLTGACATALLAGCAPGDGAETSDALDPAYVPDELDLVSADAAADAMIYSFYGRLSVASLDADALRAADLPPTFYCYGTRDPFYDQFEAQVELMSQLGFAVRARVLDGWPHGFGALGDWIPEFDDFMQAAFARPGRGAAPLACLC